MDVIIPGYNVKLFLLTLSSCLGKTGRDIYVEFTDYDGLYFKTVNDAKSAFCSFRFQPRFFERCCAPPPPPSWAAAARSSRQRRGRKRSRHQGTTSSQQQSQSQPSQNSATTTNSSSSLMYDEDSAFTCRVPYKALNSILKSRKGVRSLGIRSLGHEHQILDHSNNNDDRASDRDPRYSKLQLAFEFTIEHPTTQQAPMTIVHKIGVAECDSIMAVAPPKDRCSEIMTTPYLLNTLLDPLRRTNEISWIVRVGRSHANVTNDNNQDENLENDSEEDNDDDDDDADGSRKNVPATVTVTSFHHMDAAAARSAAAAAKHQGGGKDGAAKPAATSTAELMAAAQAAFKTESIMPCSEFEGFLWRGKEQVADHEQDDDNGDDRDESLPPNLRREVVLVFALKEVRALLQFCSNQAAASSTADLDLNNPAGTARISMSFEWGGKPIVLESEGNGFSVQLILATLDHRMLTGLASSSTVA